MTFVLFWDIDGTLLTTGRAGIVAWEDAAADVLGLRVNLQAMRTAGLTDVEIARHIAQQYGTSSARDVIMPLLRRYETLLPSRLPLRAGRVLPGVKDVLEEAARRPDVRSLLLTGNTKEGASAKLCHYGLQTYFPGGAFGEDGEDRPAIARSALAAARDLLGMPLVLDQAYVIGDTPLDIACGNAIGVRTIGVATGEYAKEDLDADGAWWAVECLPDPQTFFQKITAVVGGRT